MIPALFAKPLIKYGVPVAGIALLMLAVWIQGLRMHSWKVQAGAYQQTIVQMKAASDTNHKAQLAQKAAAEQRYKDIAHDADQEHAKELADANGALARYIATHRVRSSAPGGSISPASSPAESGNPEGVVGPRFPPDMVAVSVDDLEICTVNTTRLQAAHDWALSLEGSANTSIGSTRSIEPSPIR